MRLVINPNLPLIQQLLSDDVSMNLDVTFQLALWLLTATSLFAVGRVIADNRVIVGECVNQSVKKQCIAVYGNPSHSYGVSLAIWDLTALPSTRHK